MKGQVDIPSISPSLLPALPLPLEVPVSGLSLIQFLWQLNPQAPVGLGVKVSAQCGDVLGVWVLWQPLVQTFKVSAVPTPPDTLPLEETSASSSFAF